MKTILIAGLCALSASAAFGGGHGASSFQNTCSQIGFAYAGNDATIQAVCLAQDGTALPTSMTIMGIANVEGELTASGGDSTFQQSCGNIRLELDPTFVNLSANCRKSDGTILETTIELLGILNEDGELTPNM